MDCEKFDRVVLDLLYEELDELTSAAAKRHMDHCVRCHDIGAGLRATREVGVLPFVEPPDGLEARILEAEQKERARLPLRKRLGRGLTILADYAMRPQLAMAALLMLMIGASLLLLRARPGDRDSVQVTERGVPESEGEAVAVVPAPERLPASEELAHGPLPDEAAGRPEAREKAEDRPQSETKEQSGDAGSEAFQQALAAYRAGRYAEAERLFEAIAEAGGDEAPQAALHAARSARASGGCPEAAARFDEVHSRYAGTAVAAEAAWQAAGCYRSMGQIDRARKNYQALADVPGYADRAQTALAALEPKQEAVAARKARAAPQPAAAPKAAAKPAPPKASESAPAQVEADDACEAY